MRTVQKKSNDPRGHAGTLFMYPLLLLLISIVTDHPLYLGALLMVLVVALVLYEGVRTYVRTLKFSIPLLLLLLVINVVVNKNGATLLYKGPALPFVGQMRITWESLVYGGVMGLRMLVLLGIFALMSNWLPADRALGLSARIAKRSAITAMMTTRLIPYLHEQSQQIGDVLRTRGVKFEEGSVIARLAARRPLLTVLLLSSLEGSWQVAEAMEARGFGSGKRSSYTRERWSKRDGYVWLCYAGAVALVVWSWETAWMSMVFYPQIETMFTYEGPWPTLAHATALTALLLGPLFLLKKRRRHLDATL